VGDDSRPDATIPKEKVFVRVTLKRGMPLPPKPGETPRPFAEPIVAIRGDGEAVWSEDRLGNGPLRHGRIATETLEKWIADVRAAGTLTDPAMRSHVGPDASSVELAIDLGDQKLQIVSWHEVIDETKVIATEQGLISLDGRDPQEIIARQSAEYRRFLAGWTALRTGIDGILPRPGNAVPEGKTVEELLGGP
jgi:hypothetical protein